MDIEAQLESIDKKIETYDEKVDNLSSLITTLIHTFQQNKSPDIRSELIDVIEEKLKNTDTFPDVEGMRELFSKLQENYTETQNELKLKIVNLEKSLKKVSASVQDISASEGNSVTSELKSQLTNIELNIAGLSDDIEGLKSFSGDGVAPNFAAGEKMDEIRKILKSQDKVLSGFKKSFEEQISSLEEKLNGYLPAEGSSELGSGVLLSIKSNFDDLNISITSLLSAIKIVDKKYTELQNFQDVVDKMTSDVVSPILLAGSDVKSFVTKATEQFDVMSNFVQEYDKGEFVALSNKIENVTLDVGKLLARVGEFKTNSDPTNPTLSDNIEKIEKMLAQYNENLEELTKNSASEVVKGSVKSLNDEFYLELLNLFNSLSFDEEAEDLKDFIQEVLSAITVKTNENSEKLNNIMMQFKSLLNKIEGIERAQNSISDYLKPEESDELVYSFDDIQTDLAKMRLVLNDISKNVNSSELVDEISDKIKKTGEQIATVSTMLSNSSETGENVADIRTKVEALNEQVYDISVRTNKLLLSNEDSNTELKNNLEIFKEVFDRANPEKLYELFYELTHYFNEVNEKINDLSSATEKSYSETIMIKNALVYVGEWLDNATAVLEEMRSNTYELLGNKTAFSKDNGNELASSISAIEKRLDEYEANTQKRLDTIEEKLDKLLAAKSTAKETTSKPITTKLDNINKKFSEMEETLSRLSEQLMKE